jgi:hypothetical protein
MKSPLRYLPALISTIGLATAMSASADLLVDRGLPTINLNNDAGANRANVDWNPTQAGQLLGDNFQNTSSQAWSITKISVWSDCAFDKPTIGDPTLWGGVEGSTISLLPGAGVIGPDLKYANTEGYQAGNAGGFWALHEIDFAVNVTLAPGQTYDFFFGASDTSSLNGLAYVEASNAALSGYAPGQLTGADDRYLSLNLTDGTVTTVDSATDGTWDKASDVNVQVWGTPVPEPSTMLAGALLLLPFGVSTVRKLRKNRTA